ncbi:MAG: phosphotransferase [Pseudomonadota bacterium]
MDKTPGALGERMIAAAEKKVNRDEARARFLASTPWADASVEPLGSDASIRQYFRLIGGPHQALLMDAPTASLEPPCPPSASTEERRALGYVAMVRGPGNALPAYNAASIILDQCGLLVPSMVEMDAANGFGIVEDLGDQRVALASFTEGVEERLYGAAADALDALRSCRAVRGRHHGWVFQTYDAFALETEAGLLAEWYFPKVLERDLSAAERARLADAWSLVISTLSPPISWVHRDFHADNLMVCGDRVGVIDFQDLMVGQAAYDWASLIEDARRDVAPDVRQSLYQRGLTGADDPTAFAQDYAILAAQRNAKILGIFARLAHRDGKRRYLDLLPRVRRFFAEDLERPAVHPVRLVIKDIAPELLHG